MTQRTDKHDPRVSIKMGRHYRGLTQEDLAAALTRQTGEHWTRPMVANLEIGKKQLTVDTLLAIAEIQDLPVSFYLEGPQSRSKGVYVRSARQPVPAFA